MGRERTVTQVYQPTPPPQPSTADAIRAWVNAMPEVFALQQQFAPQEAQQQLELLQQFATPTAQALREAQTALTPETVALQEQLAGKAAAGIEAGLPPDVEQQYLSDIRANIGENVGSPISARTVAGGLANMRENWRKYYQNLGLSLTGAQPIPQPSMPQFSNFAGGFTPQGVMGFQARTYAPFAAASRPFVNQQVRPSPFNFSWNARRGLGFGYGGR